MNHALNHLRGAILADNKDSLLRINLRINLRSSNKNKSGYFSVVRELDYENELLFVLDGAPTKCYTSDFLVLSLMTGELFILKSYDMETMLVVTDSIENTHHNETNSPSLSLDLSLSV